MTTIKTKKTKFLKTKFIHAALRHVSNKTAFLKYINLASGQDENTFTNYENALTKY